MQETIKCEICGREFKSLSTTHLASHNETFKSYKEKFPKAALKSEKTRSKVGVTLEKMIEKYGPDEGANRYNSYCEKQAISNSFEYKQKKHGWTKEQYDAYNASRASTKENMIKRYGQTHGTQKWVEYCKRQAYAGVKEEYFIEKYGVTEGQSFYKKLCEMKRNTLENFVKRHGEELGVQKYKEFNEKNIERLCREKYIGISKIQNIFAEMLAQRLDESFHIHCGLYNKEFHRYDEINKKNWFYDFVISQPIKLCVEFNGDFWHANPELYKKDDIIKIPKSHNLTAGDIWEKDQKKLDNMRRKGYIVKVVWEKDFNANPEKIIEEIYICIMQLKQSEASNK